MKNLKLLAMLPLLAAPRALAGTTLCSSADQRVSTVATFPDGGAPFEPTYGIALDGTKVYERDVFSGSDIQTATYAMSKETEISSTPMSDTSPQIRVFAFTLSLTDRETGDALYSDYLLCKTTSTPCPLCP